MDLWIRSQDREKLVKVNDIALKETELAFDEIINYNINILKNLECKIVGYFDKETEFEILGKYNSKKRALEVLDEIQKFLQPDFKCDGYETETANGYYNTIKLHFSEPNIFHKRIYEMPKE